MRKVVPKDTLTMPPEAKRVFKGIIFDVYHWQQQMYDGTYETFERLKRPDTVQIIAVKDDKIVLQKQQQADWPEPKYSIPGGRRDENEDEFTAAKRELLEETGMRFKTWRLIVVKQPHSKIDWLVYTFLATGFESQTEPTLDAGERIITELVPFAKAKDLLASDKSRFNIKEITEAGSITELLAMPEYTGANEH